MEALGSCIAVRIACALLAFSSRKLDDIPDLFQVRCPLKGCGSCMDLLLGSLKDW